MSRTYPRWLMRLISRPPVFFYRIGLGAVLGRKVLLLTTLGRKTGLARTTPLQYELIDGLYYIGSMRGSQADWYKNIVANQHVKLRVGRKTLEAVAEPIDDPQRVYDFLRYRLDKHPRLIGAILAAQGLTSDPAEGDLRDYSSGLTIVAIEPVERERINSA